MKIDHFNRATCREVGEAAIEALRPVAEKFGLSIEQGRGLFDGGSFTMKAVFSTIGEGGIAQTPEAQDWARFATLEGFEESDLGREVKLNGEAFKIVGWKYRSRKFPVLAERISDGKRFKFPAGHARYALTFSPVGGKK